MSKILAITAIAAALAIAALAAASGPARATYPGATNGRIAFGINVGGNTDVYTARADGQGLRRLTTDPGFDACAAYSADGRRIAYCSGQGGGPPACRAKSTGVQPSAAIADLAANSNQLRGNTCPPTSPT